MTGSIKKRRFHSIWRLLPVLVTGIALSVTCSVLVRTAQLAKRQAQFENMAKSHLALVRQECQTRVKEIGSLQRFFEGSTFVSISEFRRFIDPWVSDGSTSQMIDAEWIPRVRAEDRSSFENEFLEDTLYGVGISENGESGEMVRASDRDEYFPILYAEPSKNNRAKIGFDLGSNPQFFHALKKSGDIGISVVVFKVTNPADADNEFNFQVIYPVYRGDAADTEQRRLNLAGFVAGSYRFNDLLETALHGILSGGIDLVVSDVSAQGEKKLLWRHFSSPENTAQMLSDGSTDPNAILHYSDTFEMSDRTWEVVYNSAPGFINTSVSLPFWIILAAGLILTGLLAVHLNMLQERNRKVSALVQKRTEELQESQTRLELAFAGADLGYWDLRVPSGERIFSSRWAEMIGYSPDEIEPSVGAWQKAIHPYDREKVMETLNLHLKGSTPEFEAEYRLRHRDGHDVWVLDRGRVIERNTAGEAVRACGTCLDITVRKQARQARDLLAAAVEQIGDSLIINDQDGFIQYVNSTFEQVTGYTREEVMGKLPHYLSGNDNSGHLFPEILKTLQAGKTWQGMVDSRKKDGTLYYESATISPVFDENGDMIHHVAIRHDLTDRLRLEEEKERLELQYHQAQKLESIGRLAGGIAHDLNNLLGPILGYSEMLLYKIDKSDKQFGAIDAIRQAGLRARDMVRHLLAFSRKQSLSIREVDLSNVVEGFQDLLRRTLLENIQIQYKLTGGLTIKADVGQLEQVLMNLAVNAQDAMPEGGLFVIETAETFLDTAYVEKHSGITIHTGRYAMLQVSDTGHGMDKAILEKVFEPFFSTKDTGKGTGLGLAMVYGTVKQHNGYIWAYSERGKGTSFKVYFPLVEASPLPVSPQVTETPVKAGVETVMVVEDDASVRKLTLEMLSLKGYQVLTAANGAECLELLEKDTTPIHILLTDVIMPDMNGKELYSQVEKRLPGLKVIYMSGYPDDVIAHHGVLASGVHFIQKPFSVRDIAAKVRAVLDEAESKQ